MSKPDEVKYSPTVSDVREVFGDPPVAQSEWINLCQMQEYPMQVYTATSVNARLLKLCPDASPPLLSTSLRDLCHGVLKQKFKHKAEEITHHTVHRSTKAMMANYISARPVSASTRQLATTKASRKADHGAKARSKSKKTSKAMSVSTKKRLQKGKCRIIKKH